MYFTVSDPFTSSFVLIYGFTVLVFGYGCVQSGICCAALACRCIYHFPSSFFSLHSLHHPPNLNNIQEVTTQTDRKETKKNVLEIVFAHTHTHTLHSTPNKLFMMETKKACTRYTRYTHARWIKL